MLLRKGVVRMAVERPGVVDEDVNVSQAGYELRDVVDSFQVKFNSGNLARQITIREALVESDDL